MNRLLIIVATLFCFTLSRAQDIFTISNERGRYVQFPRRKLPKCFPMGRIRLRH